MQSKRANHTFLSTTLVRNKHLLIGENVGKITLSYIDTIKKKKAKAKAKAL